MMRKQAEMKMKNDKSKIDGSANIISFINEEPNDNH
jgi:hypothetical protein